MSACFLLVKVDEPLRDSSDLMVKTNHSINNTEHEAQFSEDEDDIPLGMLSFLPCNLILINLIINIFTGNLNC